MTRLRRALPELIDVAALGAALYFIATFFPKDVMFSTTTTNGGDMGAHFYPAYYMRNVLLPKGQVVGWCPGTYCGYPIFQIYFPLPFVLMAALSLAIPFPIAFKLVTVLGVFLLPVCGYFGLRLGGVPFPGPALGALGTLCFLFLEANSMWGGNIPSTLAGEFALSLSLAFTVLFLGSVRWTMRTGRGHAGNGVLVALIGLSHGYTLLWAGFTSLGELITPHGWWRRVRSLVAIHGLAILLMGAWLVPMIAYAPWTTAYNHSWPIRNWREPLPPILWPPAIIALATALLLAVLSVVRRRPFPRGLATIWWSILVAAIFYLGAHSFHVVDIRFLPFVQLALCLAAGAGLGYLLADLPGREIWPVVGILTILPFVSGKVTFIRDWVRWNYSGFERKNPWPTLEGIMDHLHGDFRDPRVVYEHSPDHESLGTVRVFEDLPLFSGRSTLEGLYFQGSPTAPFVFYVQSEISKDQSCPFPDWHCTTFDLDRGIGHLRMLNVSQYLVKSAKAKAAAAANPALEREKVVGAYEIYRIRDQDGRYAVPLATAPVLLLTRNWKEASYRWFTLAGPDDVVPVFAEAVTPEEEKLFAGVFTSLPDAMPRVDLGPPPVLEEHLETDRITLTGTRPGYPVLIRISYHPRWHALTGEKIWLAGPTFMLVFPRGETVELAFGSGPPVVVGQLFSIVGLVLLAGAFVPAGRRLGAAVARPVLAWAPVAAVVAWVRRTGEWPEATRRTALVAGLVASAAALGVVAILGYTPDADSVYREAQRAFTEERFDDAAAYFREAQRIAPLSTTAVHANYYEAIIQFRKQNWAESAKIFERLLDKFPDALNAPEARYHVGLCRSLLGDVDGAVAAWKKVAEEHPDTQWGKFARDRLAEVEARGGK